MNMDKDSNIAAIDATIRRVVDFPKNGVMFYDITSLLMDTDAFQKCIRMMAEKIRADGATSIIGVEARGFLFAAPLAIELGLPLVLARKNGKLPGTVESQDFALEYGVDTINIHRDDLCTHERYAIVDDILATGGTIDAILSITRRLNASISGIYTIIGLPFLGYKSVLSEYSVYSLLEYDSE